MPDDVKAALSPAEEKLAADYARARATLPGGVAVSALRDAAFEAFKAAGLPTRRVEAWHYTDLRIAMRDALPVAIAPKTDAGLKAKLEKLAPRIADLATTRLVLVDGALVEIGRAHV